MKTLYVVLLTVILFYGCEQQRRPAREEKHSFAKIIRNPSDYQQPIGNQTFTNGVIIFKKVKDDTGVLVVTDSLSLKSGRELRDDEVIAIKVKPSTVQKTNIGDIINVSGWTTRAERNGKELYYVLASTMVVVGKENVEDPDFEKIVAAVAAKSQGWDLIDIVIVYTLFNMMLDDN